MHLELFKFNNCIDIIPFIRRFYFNKVHSKTIQGNNLQSFFLL